GEHSHLTRGEVAKGQTNSHVIVTRLTLFADAAAHPADEVVRQRLEADCIRHDPRAAHWCARHRCDRLECGRFCRSPVGCCLRTYRGGIEWQASAPLLSGPLRALPAPTALTLPSPR